MEPSAGSEIIKKKAQIKRKRDDSDIRKHLVASEGDDIDEEEYTTSKKKKPKHLNRKIAHAQEKGDTASVEMLMKQAQDLTETKSQRLSKWEALCKKLVGSDKWDQAKFDRLMQIGLSKKKMLEALGVERLREKKKDSNTPKRKTISRNKKKQKLSASSVGKDKSVKST